ncbi:MAG: ATP-dependent Clp protease adaptor ClpS [Pirellulaceae bacterium]|nr:ATP-dependent Clp protease adaptor ClpS [Pirellulaceae bacterium]
MSESSTAAVEEVAAPVKEQRSKSQQPKPKRQPRYNVILWDDQHHTVDYVVRMMKEIFRMSEQEGLKIAEGVDRTGRAICLTTTKEHAELKRDQIHAYGSDPHSVHGRSKGSMWASIEPMP